MGQAVAPPRATRLGSRLPPALAVIACAEFPVLELAGVAVGATPGALLPAALVTAAYLGPFLWIVVGAVRGRRPAGAWWGVAAIAAVFLVAVPLLPDTPLPVFPALAVSAMLLVPPVWTPPVLLGLAAATVPLAVAAGVPVLELWYPREVLWLSALVALVAAARRLEQARRDLADQALLRERLRIDDELRGTVGAALGDLVRRAEGLAAAGRAGDGPARGELAELVVAARRTLAQARRLVRGYRRRTLRAELETAATLLAAAGRPARVELPGEVPAATGERLRGDLQAALTALLGGRGPAGPVVLRVERGAGPGGTHRLVVAPAHGAPPVAPQVTR